MGVHAGRAVRRSSGGMLWHTAVRTPVVSFRDRRFPGCIRNAALSESRVICPERPIPGSDTKAQSIRGLRSTLLMKFIDQFVNLSNSGVVPHDQIHVADTGLVFVLRKDEAQKFAENWAIIKSDQ